MGVAWREVAKFASGFALHETLGHWWLGTAGRELLPWDFGWFTFTSWMNLASMVLWPIALGVLVWYGWVRRSPGARSGVAGSGV